jgi:hypothetical protein
MRSRHRDRRGRHCRWFWFTWSFPGDSGCRGGLDGEAGGGDEFWLSGNPSPEFSLRAGDLVEDEFTVLERKQANKYVKVVRMDERKEEGPKTGGVTLCYGQNRAEMMVAVVKSDERIRRPGGAVGSGTRGELERRGRPSYRRVQD